MDGVVGPVLDKLLAAVDGALGVVLSSDDSVCFAQRWRQEDENEDQGLVLAGVSTAGAAAGPTEGETTTSGATATATATAGIAATMADSDATVEAGTAEAMGVADAAAAVAATATPTPTETVTATATPTPTPTTRTTATPLKGGKKGRSSKRKTSATTNSSACAATVLPFVAEQVSKLQWGALRSVTAEYEGRCVVHVNLSPLVLTVIGRESMDVDTILSRELRERLEAGLEPLREAFTSPT